MQRITSTRLIPNTAAPKRGFRILVDAQWPEGLSRSSIDRWIPELAPSDWLTDHFGHDRTRWGTFRSRYRRQLASRKRRALLTNLTDLAIAHPIILLTAAPAETINHARLIAEALTRPAGT
jgi:uncharacterized protein YeaO (DUF488 family)